MSAQGIDKRMLNVKKKKKNPTEKTEDVPLVEFTYLVFTYMPGESYVGDLSLLYLCYIFRVLINSFIPVSYLALLPLIPMFLCT